MRPGFRSSRQSATILKIQFMRRKCKVFFTKKKTSEPLPSRKTLGGEAANEVGGRLPVQC